MIILQTLATTGDGAGGAATEDWTNFAPAFYAKVEPLYGRELAQAHQVNDELTHRIVMRYYPGVASNMRVKYGTRIFLIESIIDVDERHRGLVLMCKELVA